MTQDRVVSIVDADVASSAAVKHLLGTMGLASASYRSANEFFHAFDPFQPGCVILEICIPGMNGLQVQQELAKRSAPQPVIFLTAHAVVSLAVCAMQAGAVHLLEKPFREDDLREAVVKSLVLYERRRKSLLTRRKFHEWISQLSQDEQQLARRIVAGESSGKTAREMGVSVRTIQCRRSQIMKKLRVRNVAELMRVCYAMESDNRAADSRLERTSGHRMQWTGANDYLFNAVPEITGGLPAYSSALH